jgi:hypothetical protein
VIVAIPIGQLIFAMQRQIRGWRFVGVGLVGQDGGVRLVNDTARRRSLMRVNQARRRRRRRKMEREAMATLH